MFRKSPFKVFVSFEQLIILVFCRRQICTSQFKFIQCLLYWLQVCILRLWYFIHIIDRGTRHIFFRKIGCSGRRLCSMENMGKLIVIQECMSLRGIDHKKKETEKLKAIILTPFAFLFAEWLYAVKIMYSDNALLTKSCDSSFMFSNVFFRYSYKTGDFFLCSSVMSSISDFSNFLFVYKIYK